MKLAIQILTGLALGAWLMVAMMSPMLLGSPESVNSTRALWSIATIIGYPILIGVCFYVLGGSLFGLGPRTVLLLCSAPPLALLALLGIPQAAFNHLRGVSPYGYTTTDNAVYLHGSRIEGADPKSFAPLPDGYFDYARDAQRVYYRTRPVPGADPASFSQLSERSHGGYWRDRSSVFREGQRVEHADSASFELLSPFYARDREHVFFNGEWLRDIDTASFEVLNRGGAYARDRSGLYFFDRRAFEGADPNTFEIIEDSEYARDAQRVYRCPRSLNDPARVIEGADPATFTVLERGYAKDRARVYHRGDDVEIVEGADAASFEVTNYDAATESEAKDRSRRYMQGKPL